MLYKICRGKYGISKLWEDRYVKDSFFIVFCLIKLVVMRMNNKMLGSGRGGEIQINLKVQMFYPSKNYNRKNCDSLEGTLVLIFAYVVDKI